MKLFERLAAKAAEHPLWNLDLGIFLPHGEQKGPHLDLGLGQHIVLEEESTHCYRTY